MKMVHCRRSNDDSGSLITNDQIDPRAIQRDLLNLYGTLLALNHRPVSIAVLGCASGRGITLTASLVEDYLIPRGFVTQLSSGNDQEPDLYQAVDGVPPVQDLDTDKFRQEAALQLLGSDDFACQAEAVEVCLHLEEHGEQVLLQYFAESFNGLLCYRLAAACLTVGRAAVPDFTQAARYLNFGIRSVRAVSTTSNDRKSRSCWHEQYELSLALYSAAAEVNHGCSQFSQASDCIEEVKRHAKCALDTITARATEVHVAGFQGNKEGAVAIGLAVLSQLGYHIPMKPGRLDVLLCFHRLQFVRLGRPTSRMIYAKEMTNQKALAAMKMLQMVFSYAFIYNPRIVAMASLIMVRLTFRYGLCVISAPAFGMYGILLSQLEKDEESNLFSQLALDVHQRYDSKQWLPRTYVSVYGRIIGFASVDRVFGPLLEAYQTAFSTGDVEFCYIAAHLYIFSKFAAGCSLHELRDELYRMHGEVTERYTSWRSVMMEIPVLLIRHFTNEEPILLHANLLDGATSETLAHISQNPALASFVNSIQIYLAFVLGDHQLAYAASQCKMSDIRLQFKHPFVPAAAMARGLSHAAHYLRTGTGRKTVVRELRLCIDRVKTAAFLQPAIASAKLFVLQGELSWIEKKPKEAFFFYKNACSCESPIMDRAVAHERLSLFLAVQRKDRVEARKYLVEAKALYTKWGAIGKAQSLLPDIGGHHA